MKILMGAQPWGFGPASKLVTIARLATSVSKYFVGSGISAEFAHQNRDAFTEIIECDTSVYTNVRPFIESCDCAIAVMDADLAFWAAKAECPIYFFDSLFSYWFTGHGGLQQLVTVCDLLRTLDTRKASDLFRRFSPHERVLLAHMLAHRSYVQNFPGVEARVKELRNLGVQHIQTTGPMIDRAALYETASTTRGAPREARILVNLGGFCNPFMQRNKSNGYLRLIQHWARDYIEEHSVGLSLTICSGGFATIREHKLAGSSLIEGFLPHRAFVRAVRDAGIYLCTPGLTTLAEAAHLGSFPLLLPEQHFGHVFIIRALRETMVGQLAIQFRHLTDDFVVPANEAGGARALVKIAEAVVRSETLYDRFYRQVETRIENLVRMPRSEQAKAIGELRALFHGPPLKSCVDSIVAS